MSVSARFRTAVLTASLIGVASAATEPKPILEYIKETWVTLTRSHKELAAAAVDPKFKPGADGKWLVYIPADENVGRISKQLTAEMAPGDFAKIRLVPLEQKGNSHQDPGLLYLPRPYVVPGGRFNEMYGWDSYFIQVGLLNDHMNDLAKDMADNFLYEVREYGKVLNANRTYYLTRSQPPFLTEMVLGTWVKTKDNAWLESALPQVEAFYKFWTSEPHLTAETGLSRYYDLGDGPAPEVVSSERDAQGRTHYQLIEEYFKTHDVTDYDVTQYFNPKRGGLTDLFYKGDRSMRESGFDPSDRFGPFNLDIIHYDPVCLNSLLYLMETQTAAIYGVLGKQDQVAKWHELADKRAAKINALMWDDGDGLYYDYNFQKKQVRKYPFLTTFYPLWAGFATPQQAARVVKNLSKFEREGGLQTSMNASGDQWDSPFGWAPLEMIATEGLRRYGYKEEANRVASKWLTLIEGQYRAHGIIVEKYDVVHNASYVSNEIKFGYRSNEIGFGWTNASFTSMLKELSPETREKILTAPAVSGN
jgi:alpha,alpha-trehalase